MGLGPITVGITADMSKFAKEAQLGFTQALPSIDLSAKNLGRMAGEAITTGVKVGMVAFGAAVTAAVAGAAYAFTSFTKQGIELADSLADSAQGLGVSSSALLLFREAAVQAGADVSALENAMSKFNIKMGDAKLGSEEAVKAFSQIGVSVQQLQSLSPEAAFQLVANALGRVQDASIRASYAMDIFGKSGAPIAKALGAIGEKTLELEQYWRALGGTITAETINAAGAMSDRIELLHDGLGRFKILLASEIAPWLSYMADTLEDSIKKTGGLGKAAKETGGIFGKVVSVATSLSQAIYGVGKIIGGIVKLAFVVGDAFNLVWDQFWLTAKFAINSVAGELNGFIATAMEKFRMVKDAIGGMFFSMAKVVQDAILGVFNGIIKAWNAVVDATGLGSKGSLIEVDNSVSYSPTDSQAGPAESAMKMYAEDRKKAAKENLAEMKKLGEKATKIAYDAAKSALMFGDGMNNLTAAIKGGTGSWADEIAKGVQDAADKLKADDGKKTNQQLIDEYNKTHMMRNIGTGAPGASGLSLPSSAARNTTPVSSYGPPVTVNQQFATGVTAQDLRRAAQTIKTETIAAVQKKVSQGGDYRREIQC